MQWLTMMSPKKLVGSMLLSKLVLTVMLTFYAFFRSLLFFERPLLYRRLNRRWVDGVGGCQRGNRWSGADRERDTGLIIRLLPRLARWSRRDHHWWSWWGYGRQEGIGSLGIRGVHVDDELPK